MNIPAAKRAEFSAVTVHCAYPDGKLVGSRFPCVDWLDSNSIEVVHRWRSEGEKWGFQRTDIMRAFPFPENIQDYVPEGIVWTQISLKYKTRFVNEILRTYHQTPGSIMNKRSCTPQSAEGTALWMSSVFEHEWPYFVYNKLWFLRCGVNFTRFHLHQKKDPISRAFKYKGSATALILALSPVGCLAYVLDRSGTMEYLRKAIRRPAGQESLENTQIQLPDPGEQT